MRTSTSQSGNTRPGQIERSRLRRVAHPGNEQRQDVDVALEDAGYDVVLTLNPSAVKVVWNSGRNLVAA